MRKLAVMALALITLVGFTAACGDDEEGDKALASSACNATATTGTVTLPAGFPAVQSVTYHASTAAGPSTITTGTAGGSLDDVYSAYKTALGKSPYGVTKSEKDDHDAEVNYDSGSSTGQVRLRECSSTSTAVELTDRPK